MNIVSSFVCTREHLSVLSTDLSQIRVTGVTLSGFSLSYFTSLLYSMAATMHRHTNIKAQSLDTSSREFRDLLTFKDILAYSFPPHIVSLDGDNSLIQDIKSGHHTSNIYLNSYCPQSYIKQGI